MKDALPPGDIYTDINEVFWKHLVAQTYISIEKTLPHDPTTISLCRQFIDLYNGTYTQSHLCSRVPEILHRLRAHLVSLGQLALADSIDAQIYDAVEQIKSIPQFSAIEIPTQSRAINGAIYIADQSVEQFASAPSYLEGILRLFNEKDPEICDVAKDSYYNHRTLTKEQVGQITSVKARTNSTVDILTSCLLDWQMSQHSPSIQMYEPLPTDTTKVRILKRSEVMKQSFGLMGYMTGCVINLIHPEVIQTDFTHDPIQALLVAIGQGATPNKIEALQCVALAHSTHGLNSGELTAQLAGSVRTSLPYGLIAGLSVRSGVTHAGAIVECMQHLHKYLSSNITPEQYLDQHPDRLPGFGHRIHKVSKTDSTVAKDPRVAMYIDSARKGYPEKVDIINRIESLARVVKERKPTLGANTDFGAATLFTCMKLSPEAGSSLFTLFRIPGLVARMVNELGYKANSRRPPFAPVLPYPVL